MSDESLKGSYHVFHPTDGKVFLVNGAQNGNKAFKGLHTQALIRMPIVRKARVEHCCDNCGSVIEFGSSFVDGGFGKRYHHGCQTVGYVRW